nr:uncharacterized protein LOC110379398 [Helicoverpa armigera]
MYIFISMAVLPLVARFITCESTKEPLNDVQSKTTFRIPINEASTSPDPSNTLNEPSLWDNRPTHINKPPQDWADNSNTRYKILLRAPHSLTKLAKTLSLGFDPSFSKDYFEPFERRPRPVTLVSFRKNGLASRHMIKYADDENASEVAELQSPFNEVSNFWQNEQFY